MQDLYNGTDFRLVLWLKIMCISIVIIILFGGFTRLSDAGLSITKWNPVIGIIPPFNDAQWQIEFDQYKLSPEYVKLNSFITLSEFKSLFWIEFIHRIIGRMVVILYLLPMVFFMICGIIKKSDYGSYFAISVLFVIQGVMGWYMVKSGLIDVPHVSHYRLAIHLLFAVFIYSMLFWQMMKHSFDILIFIPSKKTNRVYKILFFIFVLLLVQICFGAFVAGLNAGLLYNDFPYMGDRFIPYELTNHIFL